jgi:hypothetical protein
LTFKKFDQGKPEFDMVAQFDKEFGEVNQVMEFGAQKYGRDNWKLADSKGLKRYRNAAIRHIFASYFNPIDSDSGLSHLAHALTNLLFISYLGRAAQVDDKVKSAQI